MKRIVFFYIIIVVTSFLFLSCSCALLTTAGFTSFISHAGGPPVNAYVVPLKLKPILFTGTMAFLFFFALTVLPLAQTIAISFIAPLIALFADRVPENRRSAHSHWSYITSVARLKKSTLMAVLFR